MRTALRPFVVLLVAVLVAGLAGACSDSPADVERQFCTEQQRVGETFARVVATAQGADLAAVAAMLPELRGRLDQLGTLATELTDAKRAAVTPTLDAARRDVAALTGATSIESLRAALAAMASAYGPTLASLRNGVDCA
jgi:hypothetical protein